MWKSTTLKYSGIGVIVVGILVFLSTSVDIFVTSDIKQESEATTPLMRCSIESLYNFTNLGYEIQNAQYIITEYFEDRASFVGNWEKSLLWSTGASVQVQNGLLLFTGTGEYGLLYKKIIPDISFTYRIEGIFGDNSGILVYPMDSSVPYIIRILSATKYGCRIELNNKTSGDGSVIFSRGDPPPVRAYTIRIIGPVLIVFWHFWDKDIPDIVQESNLIGLRGPFKLGLLSEHTKVSYDQVSVSEYHGTCVDPYICRCTNGWEGESCNVATRIKSEEELAVEKEYLIKEYFGKQRAAVKDPRKEIFLQEMKEYQYPKDCSTARFARISLYECCSGYGIYSGLHHAMITLDWAFRNQRTFYLSDPDPWQSFRICDLSSYRCIFEEITSCNANDLQNNYPVNLNSDMLDDEQRVVKFERLEWQKMGYFNGWGGFDTNPMIDQVPGKYKKMGVDRKWWRAQMFSYIYRLNKNTTILFEAEKQKLGFTSPIIGIQVRGTDKAIEMAYRPDSVFYIRKAKLLREWYNVNNIFLASEDQIVFNQTYNAITAKGLNVIYKNEMRFIGTTKYSIWNQPEEADKIKVAMDSFITTWLLSECDFYVGTFGSNLARAAFELIIAKKGENTIATGVDYPWNERVLK